MSLNRYGSTCSNHEIRFSTWRRAQNNVSSNFPNFKNFRSRTKKKSIKKKSGREKKSWLRKKILLHKIFSHFEKYFQIRDFEKYFQIWDFEKYFQIRDFEKYFQIWYFEEQKSALIFWTVKVEKSMKIIKKYIKMTIKVENRRKSWKRHQNNSKG